MNKIKSTNLLVAFTIMLALPAVSQAQWQTTPYTYFNYDFNSFSYGTPTMYPLPAATGLYFGVDDAVNTSITIGDVPGMSKAVIMSNSTPAFGNVAYMDHEQTYISSVKNERGIYTFDFNQLVSDPTIGTTLLPSYHSLGGLYTNVNLAWEGRIRFNASGSSTWGINFAWVPTSAAGGNFAIMNPDYSETVVGSYTTGTVYNISIDSDFITQTYSVDIGGTRVASALPFIVPTLGTNYQWTEIFAYNWTDGVSPSITAFDNINYTMVPEPSSLLLAGLGLGGFALRIKRRSCRD